MTEFQSVGYRESCPGTPEKGPCQLNIRKAEQVGHPFLVMVQLWSHLYIVKWSLKHCFWFAQNLSNLWEGAEEELVHLMTLGRLKGPTLELPLSRFLVMLDTTAYRNISPRLSVIWGQKCPHGYRLNRTYSMRVFRNWQPLLWDGKSWQNKQGKKMCGAARKRNA